MLRPPSDNQWEKALRLLQDKQVAMHTCGPFGCYATVQGDTGVYEITLIGGEWECECVFKRLYHPGSTCAHIAACWLVWNAVKKGSEGDADGDKAGA